ncbi:GGDEF domain-containing protein [Isoptericola sp. b441]|uniref:GGDEF domain-containing protein n=1 Tax=Actinotalea lenta TaxID=3064654 RepID=A0ABT9DBQ7_9CELL|nr:MULTISPECIES: GGDEF domain-containing protein [unclassified Isoptericola]MDO8106736.1 GGDEF domain-containing protein [Isoptericola sp. b441]MDO8121552.1 GGDEF domain-containing protein [Isoptericola sp. b490]
MAARGLATRWQLPVLTGSATVDVLVYSAVVGAAVGLGFPSVLVATGFAPQVATSGRTRILCVVAGLLVAAANALLARLVIGSRLSRLARAMRAVRTSVEHSVVSGDVELCRDGCHVPVDSADEIGAVAADFNALVDAVGRAHAAQRDLADLTRAATSGLDAERLCRTALGELRARSGAAGAAVLVSTDGDRRVVTDGAVPAELLNACESYLRGPQAARRTEADVARLGWSCTALAVEEAALGVLLLPGTSPDPGRRRLVQVFAATLAVSLSNAVAHERLAVQSRVDELTGVLNRRAGLAALAEHLRGGDRAPVAVAMIDLDHFKAVNDAHGHLVGDRLLAHVADTCRRALRAEDVVLRYGGEEFVAVLPGQGAGEAAAAAERLREAVARSPLRLRDGTCLQATVSVGVGVAGDAADPIGHLLREADAALYRAKESGRNRVEAAHPAARGAGVP